MRWVHRSFVRRGLVVGLAFVVVGSLDSLPLLAARVDRAVHPETVQTIGPAIFHAALSAPGRVVRAEDGLTIVRVSVPSDLRAATPSAPSTVWRVTLTGRFPPRADRYVVLADRRPIGYGIPTPSERSLVTVSADERVLTGDVRAYYGPNRPQTSTSISSASEAAPLPATTDNPATKGPYHVTRAEYDLGDSVYQPKGLTEKVELAGDVHYPTDLSAGPFPLVLFMHGNHSTCYRGRRSNYVWPCPDGWKPLPNYAGYDYIARKLASWGYVVVSVSANGVNYFGNEVDDTGMQERGELLEKHIDLWKTWSNTGGKPFRKTFVGAIDLSEIGTMGHSRGGEGVVWNAIVDRERPTPYGIDAVLALAPVDFTRVTINEVPFAVMLPYCDGDVSDLQGVHFFDDSRYAVPGDDTPKSTLTVFGANHNFFNTVWSPSGGYPGAFDDGEWVSCDGKLTESQERHVGAAYIIGFFREHLGGEAWIAPIWTGEDVPPVPAETLVSYLPGEADRLDVDRFTEPSDLGDGEIGIAEPSGLSIYGWCSDQSNTPCLTGGAAYQDVHLSFSWFTNEQLPGLGQASLGWAEPTATLTFPLGSQDVSGFDALQFRAAFNPSYSVRFSRPSSTTFQNLVVALVDGNGDRAEVLASDVGNEALRYPLGRRGGGHFILNEVRFPLDAFEGVDLTDIASVVLDLSATKAGVINMSDLAFVR
jgi:hypothetical protein